MVYFFLEAFGSFGAYTTSFDLIFSFEYLRNAAFNTIRYITFTGPAEIFTAKENPIGSAVTEIFRYRQTDFLLLLYGDTLFFFIRYLSTCERFLFDYTIFASFF